MKITKEQLQKLIKEAVMQELNEASARKIEQLKKLAKMCVIAFKKNPDLWIDRENQDIAFDYPDYGGLPKGISNRLSSDTVDVIQQFVSDVAMGSQKFTATNLFKAMKEQLDRGYDMP